MADRLGMTVARLRAEMPNEELRLWCGYLTIEAEDYDKAQKKAGRG